MIRTDILDQFIKEFDSSDSWYDSGSYYKYNEKGKWGHFPPFDEVPCIQKVIANIKELDRNDFRYNGQSFDWDIEVTEENIYELFKVCTYFAKWWSNSVETEIQKAVKDGIRKGELKSLNDVEKIAKKILTNDIVSYKVTCYISDLLPKKIDEIYSERKYKHSWFRGKVTSIVYKDVWGRIWSKSWGLIKPDVNIVDLEGCDEVWIDALGGMSWRSKTKKKFVCEYRTTLEEQKEHTQPNAFVG